MLFSFYISAATNLQTEKNSSTKVMPSFRPGSQFSLNSKTIDGEALLHLAVNNCHISTVELLFGKGAPIDQDNNSLLHCGAKSGYIDAVRLLLDRGAPTEARNIEGDTPLQLAAKNGHPGVMRLLLDKGTSITNNTLMRLAAENSHTNVIELLLDKGASTEEALDETKNTALHYAT